MASWNPFTIVGDKVIGGLKGAWDWLGDSNAPGKVGVAGSGARANRLLKAAEGTYGAQAPQMNIPGAFGTQMQTIEELRRASKEGDPYARARLMEGAEQAARGARGAAVGAAPQNQALMARAAMQQGAAARRGAGGQAAMADVAARRSALGQLAQAGQALGQQQLGLGQANLGARMGLLGLGAQERAQMYGLEQQGALTQAQIDAGMAAAAASATPNWEKLMGAGTGLGAAALQSSDKDSKKNIRPGGEAAQEFMDGLRARTFEYKDGAPGVASGRERQLGVMAQDVERSRMGQPMVLDTPAGKMLDVGKLSTGLAAAVVHLNDRVKELEGTGAAVSEEDMARFKKGRR